MAGKLAELRSDAAAGPDAFAMLEELFETQRQLTDDIHAKLHRNTKSAW